MAAAGAARRSSRRRPATPDAVLGSGEPDFGAGVAADYSPWRRLMLYVNFNLVYPVGPITDGNLTLNPFFTQSFAAHLAVTQHCRVHASTRRRYTSPFHGTGASLLDGTVVELGFGLGFASAERFGAQLLGIENVSGVEQSADFTLMLSIAVAAVGDADDLPPIGRPAAAAAAAGDVRCRRVRARRRRLDRLARRLAYDAPSPTSRP